MSGHMTRKQTEARPVSCRTSSGWFRQVGSQVKACVWKPRTTIAVGCRARQQARHSDYRNCGSVTGLIDSPLELVTRTRRGRDRAILGGEQDGVSDPEGTGTD